MAPLVIEPVDPVQGLDLDVVDVAPRSLSVDEFGLERADGALGQSVVERITYGPDRRVDTFVYQPLGERDRRVDGEFNRSSQHLEQEVRVGTNRAVDGHADRQAVDALAGQAADPARSGACVLGEDRRG